MSPTVRYKSHEVAVFEGESALDALVRVGADIPFSCKGGVCHTCLVKCVGGQVTAEAQKGLPAHLVQAGYVLACKYQPRLDAVLTPRKPEDMITRCVLTEVSLNDAGHTVLQFEPASELKYQRGDRLRLVGAAARREPEFKLISDPADDYMLQAELLPGEEHFCPDWVHPERMKSSPQSFGFEFEVRGPFPAAAAEAALADTSEVRQPAPDPALWEELGQGRVIRKVLESFYATVYADPKLSPFFEGVTMARLIEKQYSFLKQCITGEKVYMGDRPRNAHHWMIISNELFDYRQSLMMQALRAHGLSEEQIARWDRYEEAYRPDIVKSDPWPRRIGGVDVMREGFGKEVLLVDSICDYCSEEVLTGTEVLFHLRLGKISCPSCAEGARQRPSGIGSQAMAHP